MPRRLLVTLGATLVVTIGLFVANMVAGNSPSLGLDLQGGASVTLTPKGTFTDTAIGVAVDVIRQRVDSIGVSEPEIIRQGSTVVVNLPGVKDQQRALYYDFCIQLSQNDYIVGTMIEKRCMNLLSSVGKEKVNLLLLLFQT